MGTFASLVKFNDKGIPEEKKEEFSRKIRLLFKFGGMMRTEKNIILDKEFMLLENDFENNDCKLNITYNYFEDDWWENAGFDNERCRIYSGKIGWKQFNRVMKAAYILENQYRNGTGFVECNGGLVSECLYTGWMNYIFDENKNITNFDSWRLYSQCYKNKDNDKLYWIKDIMDETNWMNSGLGYGYISFLEIQAVKNGTDSVFNDDKVKEKVNDDSSLKIWFNSFQKIIFEHLNIFRCNSAESEDEQLELLKQVLYSYYNCEDDLPDSISENNSLKEIYSSLTLNKSPVILIKKISEIYNTDFWKFYDEFESLYDTDRCGEDFLHISAENFLITKIPTSKFMESDIHKMLLFWNKDVETDETEAWFSDMKALYTELLKDDVSDFNMIEYVPDLLEYIAENYFRVYAFKCFFSETLKHMNDSRYIAYWRLIGKLARSKELLEIGSVIFEHAGTWEFMSDDVKNNSARRQLKDLMAISANTDLRMKIFEF